MYAQGDDEVCGEFPELDFEFVEVNGIDLPDEFFEFAVSLGDLPVLVVDDLEQSVVTPFSELGEDNLFFSFVVLLGIDQMHGDVGELSDMCVCAGGEWEVLDCVGDLVEVSDEA